MTTNISHYNSPPKTHLLHPKTSTNPFTSPQSDYLSTQAPSLSLLTTPNNNQFRSSGKSFISIENQEFNPHPTTSLYATSEFNFSRFVVPEEPSPYGESSIGNMNITPQYNLTHPIRGSLGKSFLSESAFTIPDRTGPFRPRFSSQGNELTESIKQQVLCEAKARKDKELRSTEKMIRDDELVISMIENERRWAQDLNQAHSVVQDCKKFLKSINKDYKEVTSTQRPPYLGPNYLQERPVEGAPVIERQGFIGSIIEGRQRGNEGHISDGVGQETRVSTIMDSYGSSDGFGKTLGQRIIEDVMRKREIRELKDLKSMEDMVLQKRTMTGIVKNEGRIARELEDSQEKIKQVRNLSQSGVYQRRQFF